MTALGQGAADGADRSADELLVELTVELLRRNDFRQDAYVRPTLYKSTEAIGVRLHGLESQLDLRRARSASTSPSTAASPPRSSPGAATATVAIPARSKIVGAYVNSAFSKTEARAERL